MAEINPIPPAHPLVKPVKIEPDKQRRRPSRRESSTGEDTESPQEQKPSTSETGQIDVIV